LKNYQSPRDRPSSSLKQKSNVESIQFNDDDDAVQNSNYTNIIKNKSDNNEHEHYQSKDIFSSSSKTELLPNQSDDNKSRKIRELQNKLTRQEEESKKKFEELHTKQSRLENAIRLLAKQSSSRKNRRQEPSDQLEGKSHFGFYAIIYLTKQNRSRCTGCQCHHSITERKRTS
jgi:hypothetical protein